MTCLKGTNQSTRDFAPLGQVTLTDILRKWKNYNYYGLRLKVHLSVKRCNCICLAALREQLKKKSEFLVRIIIIDPLTSVMLIRCSDHWTTRTPAGLGCITRFFLHSGSSSAVSPQYWQYTLCKKSWMTKVTRSSFSSMIKSICARLFKSRLTLIPD